MNDNNREKYVICKVCKMPCYGGYATHIPCGGEKLDTSQPSSVPVEEKYHVPVSKGLVSRGVLDVGEKWYTAELGEIENKSDRQLFVEVSISKGTLEENTSPNHHEASSKVEGWIESFEQLEHNDDVSFVLSKMRAKIGDVAISHMLEVYKDFISSLLLQKEEENINNHTQDTESIKEEEETILSESSWESSLEDILLNTRFDLVGTKLKDFIEAVEQKAFKAGQVDIMFRFEESDLIKQATLTERKRINEIVNGMEKEMAGWNTNEAQYRFEVLNRVKHLINNTKEV